MKKILLTLITILSLQSNLFAQDQFISIKNKYTFNLPQMGICLTIPAYGGFTVPMFSGKNVSLNVNDQTYYLLDIEYIEKGKGIFKFKAKGSENHMMLSVVSLKGKIADREILTANIQKNPNFELMPNALKTKLGNTISYKATTKAGTQNVHAIPFGEYLFLFSMPADSDKKEIATHEGIIKSLDSKDFTTQLADYETRINSGYFDYEAKAPKDVDSRYKFDNKVGKFTEATTLEFQEVDFGLSLPQNTLYRIEARNIEEEKDGKRQVTIYKLDLDESLNYMPSFSMDGIPLFIRVTDNKSLVSILSPKDAKIFKTKKFNLDGREATVEFGGSDYYGNINLSVKIKELYYIFSIYNLSSNNIGTIDKIVSSIRLPKEDGISGQTDDSPISRLFPLKESPKVPLSKISIPQIDQQKYTTRFKCQLTDLGAVFEVPGEMKDYLIRPDDNFKKTSTTSCTLSGSPKFFEGWFGVTSAGFITAAETATSPDLKSWLTNYYHGATSGNYFQVIEAGFISINGIEWAVMTNKLENGSFRRIMYHIANEYAYQYMIDGANLKEINEKSAFIHTFRKL